MEIRDQAGDIVNVNEDLLNKFKLSVFWVLGYKPGQNDDEVVEYLNLYRKHQNNIL